MNGKYQFCLLDKSTDQEIILLTDENSVVISEHELKGKLIFYEDNELYVSDNSLCASAELNQNYVVKYVNDMWNKICKNCINWRSSSTSNIGRCLMPPKDGINMIMPSACVTRTHETFGCNQFRLSNIIK